MKYCHYCGDRYIPRRSDQKFCSNQCRNRNKNEKAKRMNSVFEPALKILRKNYEILENLMDHNFEVHREEVENLGFDFHYHTHIIRENFEIWRCCGDIKYRFSERREKVILEWI